MMASNSSDSVDKIARFTYTAFEDPDSEIRLITLLPDEEFSAKIECRISTGLSEPVPEYEALSYAWGDPNILLPIIINGQIAHVTENLEHALRWLRDLHQERVLWVDAICINQQDLNEKSRQVLRMGLVYSRASQVLVWLGDADEDTALGLRALIASSSRTQNSSKKRITRVTKFSIRAWIKKRFQGSRPAFLAAIWEELLGKKRISLADARANLHGLLDGRAIAAFAKLFNYSWWTRLWIAQEYQSAQSVQFIIGPYCIPSKLMENGRHLLRSMHRLKRDTISILPTSEIVNNLRQARRILALRVDSKKSELSLWPSIIHPLFLTKRAKCEDPRDRIFAVLNLTTDSLRKQNKPDYRLSVSQVYQRFVRTWISERKNLDMLCRSQRDEYGQKLACLPSWAPDWDHPPYNILVNDVSRTSSPNFAASLQSNVEVLPTDDRSDCLALAGFVTDTVLTLGVRMPYGKANSDPNGWVVQQWRSLAQQVSSDPLQFWLTRITDRRVDNRLTASQRQNFCEKGAQELLWDNRYTDEIETWLDEKRLFTLYRWTHRRFFITEGGRMGMAHFDIEEGDSICILFGGQVPFVLRKSSPERYTFISECYIHGIMDGEAMKEFERGRYSKEYFHMY